MRVNRVNFLGNKKEKLILLLLLLIGILPFFLLFFCSFPHSDDYFFAIIVNNYGVFGGFKHLYLSWSGRFIAMILGLVNPWVIKSTILYQLNLIIYFLLFYFSIFSLYKNLSYQVSNKLIIHLFSLFSLFIFLQTSPDLYEILYWHAGSSGYLFSITLFLFFNAQIFAFIQKKITTTKFIIIEAIIGFLLAGLSELLLPIMVSTIAFHLMFMQNWSINQKKKIGIVYGFYFLFTLLYFISPGNLLRYEYTNINFSIISLLSISFKNYFLLNINFIQNPVLILSYVLIFILILKGNLKSHLVLSIKKMHPLLFLIAGHFILLIYFVFISSIINGILPGRVFNFIGFFYLIFHFLFLINLSQFIRLKTNVNYEVPNLFLKLMIGSVIILTLTGVYPISTAKFVSAPIHEKIQHVKITSNFTSAVYTLFAEGKSLKVNFKNWNHEFEKAQIAGKKTDSIFVLPTYSKLVYRNQDYSHENTWINNNETKYYGLDSVFIMPKSMKFTK